MIFFKKIYEVIYIINKKLFFEGLNEVIFILIFYEVIYIITFKTKLFKGFTRGGALGTLSHEAKFKQDAKL